MTQLPQAGERILCVGHYINILQLEKGQTNQVIPRAYDLLNSHQSAIHINTFQ